MSLSSRIRLALACALALGVLSVVQVGKAGAQDDDKPKKVSFNTGDGVELTGTFWTPTKAKKNACVILLHNFSKQKGGGRGDGGWKDLGEELQKEGYFVLSFDFRGFGDSKTVGKEFWNFKRYPANQALFKVISTTKMDLPTSIDAKNFPLTYFPYLVNDLPAAKAFLDDKAGAAAGNLIVIGAGEGATIGSMWVAEEFRRYRDTTENVQINTPVVLDRLDRQPEGRDIACGIWLTYSQSIEGRNSPAATWFEEAGGKRHKVPMLFVYGKKDERARLNASTALIKMVKGYKMAEDKSNKDANLDPDYKNTRDWAVAETDLTGSELLTKTLKTNDVIKFYINNVMEERGSKESKRHEMGKYRYFWINPLSPNTKPIQAKIAGEDFLLPILPSMMGQQ